MNSSLSLTPLNEAFDKILTTNECKTTDECKTTEEKFQDRLEQRARENEQFREFQRRERERLIDEGKITR